MGNLTHKLQAPVDAHCHFREAQDDYVVEHERCFEYALAMPNTRLPIITYKGAEVYAAGLERKAPNLKILRTCQLTPNTLPNEIIESKGHIAGWKLYPHNSQYGWSLTDLLSIKFDNLLKVLEECDIPLLVHAEINSSVITPLERENRFFELILDSIEKPFPRLRIVIEHITTVRAIEWIMKSSLRAGSIAPQHMIYNINDLIGPPLKPHLYCMPILKSDNSRRRVMDIALSGNSQFFLGSDSAPHTVGHKIAAECCAGCYTAPHLAETVFELFYNSGHLHNLNKFWSGNARTWYGLPPASFQVEAREEEWTVPELTKDSVVPLMAGQTLKWRVERCEQQSLKTSPQ